ncbi:AAA family ATPase [Lipingzhangella sp. LS1_29]|uniref:AAA family ATPase n=1 Tax=Lipingzhangella rawalii TaxID=2055835 RepID=A0ABU2H8A3_9ACTN|nr:AAA family ATPase [Lipingzhangella rawalii]MDS1271527.1 AAA family ATPase [Lipingzhangella rawalii]
MTEPVSDAAVDPEIAAERAYLARARAALEWMRTDMATTETVQDSSEDADYTYVNRVLARDRERRAEELADLPNAPLFFGRIDYRPGAIFEPAPRTGTGSLPDTGPHAESGAAVGAGVPDPRSTTTADHVYVGRRHIHDADGVPLVIDWRAQLASSFYRASPAAPQGVQLRRRFGFDDTPELTAYEDERLVTEATPGGGDIVGGLLAEEIERPRSGPMRDIVATIQPEQDELVRVPLRPALCVQGAPGTGKTAVGLHRIAYLLYTERERLRQDGGVMIIGPNRAFLSYIRNVLPALGEVGVRQTTIEELVGHVPVRRLDESAAARIKGEVRMAEVVRRALWEQPAPLEDILVVERGARRWRIYPDELAETIAELRERDLAYANGPNLLTQRLAHLVMRQMENSGEACDSSTLTQLRRNRSITAAVRKMWPKADPVRLVLTLLTDAERLGRCAEGILGPEEQQTIMLPGRPRGPKSARWSVADLALIDEAAALIDRPSTMGHIVVDEAQDLSPMQCRVIGRRCTRGSLTVLGDIAQGTSPSAVSDWTTLLGHLGQPDARLAVLDRGFRVPAEIIDYAARLLTEIAPVLTAPVGVRHHEEALRISPVAGTDLPEAVVLASREGLKGAGSVGVVAADDHIDQLCTHLRTAGLEPALAGEHEAALESSRLVCVPASIAKGLEFDAVVVVEPVRIVDLTPRGLQQLYVALTRAVSSLHIVHAEELPAALAGESGSAESDWAGAAPAAGV